MRLILVLFVIVTGKINLMVTSQVSCFADGSDTQLHLFSELVRFVNPIYVLGHKQPFSDAVKKGHVSMVSSEQTINKMTTITEVKKVAVDHVVHPVTRDKIDYNQAVIDGKNLCNAY